MSTYDRVEAVTALSQSQISKLTNPQLKEALNTIVNAIRTQEPTNTEILDELKLLRGEISEIKTIKQEVKDLSARLDEAYKVMSQQQKFLEAVDARERSRNIVITGLSEDSDEIGDDDTAKVKKVIEATGYAEVINPEQWQIRRLGKETTRRNRPIHVMLNNQQQRNHILEKAKNLKNCEGLLARIFIKKDLHPAVRKEMARLREREREEKNKPENAGTNIRYDWKNRVLLRDNVVIDKYAVNFF